MRKALSLVFVGLIAGALVGCNSGGAPSASTEGAPPSSGTTPGQAGTATPPPFKKQAMSGGPMSMTPNANAKPIEAGSKVPAGQ